MFMWIAEAPLKPAPDRLHQDRGFGDAAPAASVSLRHRNAEPAGFGHRAVELVREAT
jgi:hypothetical protein